MMNRNMLFEYPLSINASLIDVICPTDFLKTLSGRVFAIYH